MQKALYNAGRWKARRRERSGHAKTGLAELDSPELHFSHQKLDTNEIIEANTARKDVAMGDGKIFCTALLMEKGLDLFDFDQGEVLTWLIVKTKVPIAFDARTGDYANDLTLHLRTARFRGCEDAFDSHGWPF